MYRLQVEVQDLQQDRLVVFEMSSNKGHVMRQTQQMQQVLFPLRAAWEGEQSVRQVLAEMMTEHIKWIQMYEVAFSSFKGSALNQWADVVTTLSSSNGTGFPLVTDFLISTGQVALAQQGQTLDQQV